MNAIVKTEQPKRSLIVDMAEQYGMDPLAFQQTLKATVVPANVTNEDFAAFLIVAKHYKLNPILKEIFAFPKRGGGIQPIVSVDGWANLINSQPQCDGFEFIDALDEGGALVSITCKIWRKDRKYPGCATEYMAECERATDTWKQWPRRMLRHKALIQAARYTFGFAGIMEPDEAERNAPEDGHYAKTPGARLTPPPAPKPETNYAGQAQAAAEKEPAQPANEQEKAGTELSEAAYAGLRQEAFDEIEGAETEEEVRAAREKWTEELKVGDQRPFFDRCAERSAEIFGGA